tara:strand:- start:1824 stop:2000 length:177 start_codon:yes stop_codon:yes gene_type:complete
MAGKITKGDIKTTQSICKLLKDIRKEQKKTKPNVKKITKLKVAVQNKATKNLLHAYQM